MKYQNLISGTLKKSFSTQGEKATATQGLLTSQSEEAHLRKVEKVWGYPASSEVEKTIQQNIAKAEMKLDDIYAKSKWEDKIKQDNEINKTSGNSLTK